MNLTEKASDPQSRAFNPYSYYLNGNRIDGPRDCWTKLHSMVFEHRGVQCWRVSRMHFAYVKDGIVIAERVGYGEKHIDAFHDGVEGDEGRNYHDHERPQQAYKEGKQALEAELELPA